MKGTLKKYKNLLSGYKQCQLELIVEQKQGSTTQAYDANPPYLLIDKDQDRNQLVEIRKGCMSIEANSTNDFVI